MALSSSSVRPTHPYHVIRVAGDGGDGRDYYDHRTDTWYAALAAPEHHTVAGARTLHEAREAVRVDVFRRRGATPGEHLHGADSLPPDHNIVGRAYLAVGGETFLITEPMIAAAGPSLAIYVDAAAEPEYLADCTYSYAGGVMAEELERRAGEQGGTAAAISHLRLGWDGLANSDDPRTRPACWRVIAEGAVYQISAEVIEHARSEAEATVVLRRDVYPERFVRTLAGYARRVSLRCGFPAGGRSPQLSGARAAWEDLTVGLGRYPPPPPVGLVEEDRRYLPTLLDDAREALRPLWPIMADPLPSTEALRPGLDL